MTKEWIDENIDPGMRYAIKTLNEKGYKTFACCEGHYNENLGHYCEAYIRFNHFIPNELFPKLPSFPWRKDEKINSKYKTPFMEIGCGYKKNRNKEYEKVFYWTGTRHKRVSKEEKDKEHDKFILELNAWVDSLPTWKDETVYLDFESIIYKSDSNSFLPYKIVVVENIVERIHTITVKRIEIDDTGDFPIRNVQILNTTFWEESLEKYNKRLSFEASRQDFSKEKWIEMNDNGIDLFTKN